MKFPIGLANTAVAKILSFALLLIPLSGSAEGRNIQLNCRNASAVTLGILSHGQSKDWFRLRVACADQNLGTHFVTFYAGGSCGAPETVSSEASRALALCQKVTQFERAQLLSYNRVRLSRDLEARGRALQVLTDSKSSSEHLGEPTDEDKAMALQVERAMEEF